MLATEQRFSKLILVKNEIHFKGQASTSASGGYVILPNSNEAYAAADALLDADYEVAQLNETTTVDQQILPAGSFHVSPKTGLSGKVAELAQKWSFNTVGLDRTKLISDDVFNPLGNPKIGLYEPWGGNIDAGWTRLVLEQWELEHNTVRNADLKAGNLANKYDIILFPDGLRAGSILNDSTSRPEKYMGGIGDKGLNELQTFVQAGGTIAAFGRSSMALVDLFDLPVANSVQELTRKDYFAPGSLVLSELDVTSPIAYGLPDKLPVMNRRGPAFIPRATTGAGPKMIGRYPDYDPRLSGFLLGPEHIQGKGSIAVQTVGRGRVILFSMAPQFRAMMHGTYKLMFNAIFWAARHNKET